MPRPAKVTTIEPPVEQVMAAEVEPKVQEAVVAMDSAPLPVPAETPRLDALGHPLAKTNREPTLAFPEGPWSVEELMAVQHMGPGVIGPRMHAEAQRVIAETQGGVLGPALLADASEILDLKNNSELRAKHIGARFTPVVTK